MLPFRQHIAEGRTQGDTANKVGAILAKYPKGKIDAIWGPCSAATIIAELGIPKSTVYLLLGELKKQRFI
ncbi:hypothetical protein AB0055_28575, partial [Klebsiella pneumoniae]